MPHSHQSPDPINRTVLVTVRVSPEERDQLHRLAEERGETLSRMLVSRWLPERKRAKRKEAGRRSRAIEPVAASAPACAKEPPSPARSDSKRLRDGHVMPGQESLFDGLGGR